MSLSRSATFPLLKLPFLCIKDVVKSWDVFDMIFFALISKRTRRIVKSLNIPLNRIEIVLSEQKWIELDNFSREWHFRNERESEPFFDKHTNFGKDRLVLQTNAIPFCKTDRSLKSYTDGNEVNALKMAMELLNEIFKCSVKRVGVYRDNFPESGDFGVRSTVNLSIYLESHAFDQSQNKKLNLLLENLEVTDTCTFYVSNPKKDFYVNPKLLKCRRLMFCYDSAAWVTLEILLQFEVPRLRFNECPFSDGDIAEFVTQWFHSDNKKLEYLYIGLQDRQISWEAFQDLNPLPFNGRTREPRTESFKECDFSKGLEIARHDGLPATIHVGSRTFMFYIWHNQ